MSITNLISKLKAISQAPAESYVRDFEDILAKIAELSDPSSIRELACFFDDNAQYDELMFSIVHTIESFDDQTYIKEVLNICRSMINNAPRWTSIIFTRILNSDSARLELARQIAVVTPQTAQSVRDILEKISQRDKRLRDRANPIISLIQKGKKGEKKGVRKRGQSPFIDRLDVSH